MFFLLDLRFVLELLSFFEFFFWTSPTVFSAFLEGMETLPDLGDFAVSFIVSSSD
jgi:hypothetical protein